MSLRPCTSLSVAVVSVLSAAGVAQPRLAWMERWAGPDRGLDAAYHMTVDDVGNVYTVGATHTDNAGDDILVLKYDRTGRLVWRYQYDGPGHGDDSPLPVFVDDEGNVYTAGWAYGGPETGRDIVTIKISPDGQQAWAALYSGPGSRDDHLYGVHAIGITDDGQVYVVGNSVGATGYYEAALIKYDADGAELWARRRAGPPNTSALAWAVAIGDSGDVYVGGEGINPDTNNADVALTHYDADGNFDWIAYYNGPGNADDGPYEMELGPNGNLYLTGISRSSGGDIDAAVWKAAPDGQLLWDAYFDAASGAEYAFDQEIAANGDVTIVGSLHDRWGNQDTLTLRYDTDGQLLWMRTFDNPSWFGEDELFYVQLGADGSAYVIGESWNGWDEGVNAIAIRYLPDGTQDWLYEYNGPGFGDDAFLGLAVDEFGNVYTAGVSLSKSRSADVLTAKLVQNDCTGLERISSVRCKTKGGAGKLTVKLDGGVPGDSYDVRLESGPQGNGTLNNKGKGKVKFKDLPLAPDRIIAEWSCGSRDARGFECG